MTVFPSLAPSTCTFNPGNYPGNTYTALNGAQTSIRYSALRSSSALELTFANLKESDMLKIYNHYNENGTFNLFTLPAPVFAGFDSGRATFYNTKRVRWRYGEPPSIAPSIKGRHNVSVRLVSVPVA